MFANQAQTQTPALPAAADAGQDDLGAARAALLADPGSVLSHHVYHGLSREESDA
jgi:hypothetical protein